MSVQNLPLEVKDKIKNDIENYMFDNDALEVLPFYLNHMYEKDG